MSNSDDDFVPLKKKRRFEVVSEDKLDTLKKGFVPKNTSKQTDWAVRVFKDWIKESNPENDTTKCPADLLKLGEC